MRRTLKQFLLFVFLVDFSTSSNISPWKSDGGDQVKLNNGTVVTQTEFDGNAYASAAIGMVTGPGGSCLGALVSDKYFLYTETSVSSCGSSNPPTQVKLGSRYVFIDPSFNGDTCTILGFTHPAPPPLTLAKISLPSTSKAKPVALPPTSLLHTPPPVGTNCNAWGFGESVNNTLNRLAVTIVSIPDCKSRWGTFDSSVVVPENGTVFCAWVTTDGTAGGYGSICDLLDVPSLIICENWGPPTPPKPPSCGWHKSGGGGRRKISEVLAMENERVVPSYLLAGFFLTGPFPEGNCQPAGGPPVIYTYTGGVISQI